MSFTTDYPVYRSDRREVANTSASQMASWTPKVDTYLTPTFNRSIRNVLAGSLTDHFPDSGALAVSGPATSSSRCVLGDLPTDTTVSQQVFDALAEAKRWTAQVAMYLPRDVRDRIFRQLDRLHDLDEWPDDEQAPLLLKSYIGFLRFYVSTDRSSKPSLILHPSGRLGAVWISGNDRLTIEFQGKDDAKWIVSRMIDDVAEKAAGHTKVSRLLANLAPYQPEKWLSFAK